MSFTPLTNNQDNQKQTSPELLEYAKEAFSEILGEISEKIDPLFLKNRTLTVTCGNSEIATELRLKMDEIVAKINEKMGKNEIDRIRYLL
jgi:predicted nucleic acid-binding Zn ribbon protein